MKDKWHLKKHIHFLNHGSFGACPKEICNTQQKIQRQLEEQPVEFFEKHYEEYYFNNLAAVADLLGSKISNLVFINNTSFGINSVLNSINWAPGDEIIVSKHEYNATYNVARYVAKRYELKIIEVDFSLPVQNEEEIVQAFTGAISSSSRLLICDAITSATALRMPFEKIIQECNRQGVLTLIDGAHVPGQIHVNLEKIEASFFVGNCHKWLCTPKGAAILYVHPKLQDQIHPAVLSHGYNSDVSRMLLSQFQKEFFWMGTVDPSAQFCVAKSIEFMSKLYPNGIEQLMQENHSKVVAARRMLCERLDRIIHCPDEMLGAMATISVAENKLAENKQAKNHSGHKLQKTAQTNFQTLCIKHCFKILILKFLSCYVLKKQKEIYASLLKPTIPFKITKPWPQPS